VDHEKHKAIVCDTKTHITPATSATVYVPAESAVGVTESGRPATKAKGVQFLHIKQGTAVFTIGSGNYQFESKMP